MKAANEALSQVQIAMITGNRAKAHELLDLLVIGGHLVSYRIDWDHMDLFIRPVQALEFVTVNVTVVGV